MIISEKEGGIIYVLVAISNLIKINIKKFRKFLNLWNFFILTINTRII